MGGPSQAAAVLQRRDQCQRRLRSLVEVLRRRAVPQPVRQERPRRGACYRVRKKSSGVVSESYLFFLSVFLLLVVSTYDSSTFL